MTAPDPAAEEPTPEASPERIAALRAEAELQIAAAPDSAELERLRIHYLGRRAELPLMLRRLPELEPALRGQIGRAGNQARQALEAQLEQRSRELEASELHLRLQRDRIDVTLPGAPPEPVGRLHLLTATWREIEDVLVGLGFSILEGPEIELSALNWDALNYTATHPARARSDTFYINDDVLLRTHTSPMQVRAMRTYDPPLFVAIPGRVYRPDNDATHTPQFHQVEGLAVDEDITLADLKGTLLAFSQAMFGDTREIRLRPHFFPFTEPSVEIDVSCFQCEGKGHLKDGARCSLCKGEGWLEILGAGEVDPNVLAGVGRPEYDPERVQGFAWGMGIERIAMLRHGIPDLRLFYENDLRFLEQFG